MGQIVHARATFEQAKGAVAGYRGRGHEGRVAIVQSNYIPVKAIDMIATVDEFHSLRRHGKSHRGATGSVLEPDQDAADTYG